MWNVRIKAFWYTKQIVGVNTFNLNNMEQTYQVFQYEIPILLTKDFSKLGVITSNISTETYIEEIYSVFPKILNYRLQGIVH